MRPDKKDIRSILFITLSNLGDIILTTPVLEKLHGEFPDAHVDVITGAPGKEIFTGHPAVREVAVHQNRRNAAERIRQVIELRHRHYDMVVDLKNSLIPYITGARFHSHLSVSSEIRHKKDEHLSKLIGLVEDPFSDTKLFVPVKAEDKAGIDAVVDPEEWKRVVVISPGAKSHLKRWDCVKYAEASDKLVSELRCRVIVAGTDDDLETVRKFMSRVKEPVVNLCSKTTLGALAELMQRSDLVITNDSAPLHVASFAGVPTIAIFGPSDERKYGPIAERSKVIKPAVPCRPCGKALCSRGPDEGCISQIGVEEVFYAARKILER